MAGPVSLNFTSAPRLLPAYLRILLTRKPLMAAESVPRIEAILSSFRVDPRHLARYRAVCGERESEALPIGYPHVLATPVHLAMIASDAFPLSLMGVVHIANRIVLNRPLRIDDTGEIRAVLDGHRDTARGQELDLNTEVRVGGEVVWSETCTLLARRRGRRGPPRTGGTHRPGVALPPPETVRTQIFRVDSGTGRRYARVSGDFNPIHVADLAARWFGFKHAIAHGMWSLARCVAALGPEAISASCVLDAAFKLPIAFPARVILESWSSQDGLRFALRDSASERGHLDGCIRPNP